MSTDIYGWVEIRGDWELEPKWYGIVKATLLMSVDPEISAYLFGVHNRFAFQPIAEKRGLPDDVSDMVTQEMTSPFWMYTHSHSWVTLTEVALLKSDLELNSDTLILNEWGRLLTIMEVLAEQFGRENVRLVVWFAD